MLPIVDLHCDLLAYLTTTDGATAENTENIGCATPWLRQGNVKLQVMAAYVPTAPDSVSQAEAQCERFGELPAECPEDFVHLGDGSNLSAALESGRTGIVFAIENASGLCTEQEPIELALERLDALVQKAGKVLYVTLTHHTENRFGGGNQTEIGLKDDGRVLLDHLSGKRIAIDLSHTSDALARDILDHIDGKGLDIPLLASHSNFRVVQDHARNLPDELAREIVNRGGVIGLNFVRSFVDPDDASGLERHVQHALDLGAANALCFGADFFYWKGHPDQSRLPFYHEGHEHAGRYQEIVQSLEGTVGQAEIEGIAYRNAQDYLRQLWGPA